MALEAEINPLVALGLHNRSILPVPECEPRQPPTVAVRSVRG